VGFGFFCCLATPTETHAAVAVCITPVVIQADRKVPPPPAFSERVRDDIANDEVRETPSREVLN